MIISHKHKFIFLKPKKVAGTSIEVALSEYCGSQDIITPVTEFDASKDEDAYTHKPQNHEGFFNHMAPHKIQTLIPKEVWDNYYIFTVVRNPWDLMVSLYWWRKNTPKKPLKQYLNWQDIASNVFKPNSYIALINAVRRKLIGKKHSDESFEEFINGFQLDWSNYKYYFDKNNNPICDYYIRYEDLQNDYNKLCENLGLEAKNLPHLKSKVRAKKVHYSEYYNDKTKEKVEKMFKHYIEYFQYSFGTV